MKTILILLLLCSTKSLGQVFTQVFIDRCTQQPQVVAANFVNGSASVFYNRIKTFTYQEYTNGELQNWLLETYSWWNDCHRVLQQMLTQTPIHNKHYN